ncbi:Poly [ADP-ribose] polymerase 4 [Holothuria leucospilota]|uniref:Poly [ADP-ribose] polymerase n=1 Tax=Holothuria leucospilota TaxID=206669 RepID=A0A9Q0YT61_HOLLE|nr:Poly [ADP-ribose] polymerase 4 [Holothuria leucospilota]
MEVFKGRPLQNMQLHQPLNLQPSDSLMKRSVLSVSSEYSVRCGKFSLPTTSSEVPSSMQHSLEGTAVKKVRLMNDSLRKTELKLSNKFLENLSILKGFKTSDVLDKTNTQKLANTTDQGALRTKSSILKGWHVVLDLEKSSFKERLDLKNEILSHGGTVGFSVTKKTTHLLVEGISKRSFSFKRHCAQKYGVKVVSVDYVRDCLESGSVLSVEPYIAADKVEETENKENNLLSGKIKALGKQRGVLQEKPEESMKEEPFIWEDFESKAEYQIAKFCFMKDLKNESPSRCLLVELHVLTEPTARRYRIYCQFLLGDKSVVEKCFSLSSSLQAVAAYCKITKSLQPMFSITDVKSEKFGSPKFQKMQMETHTISADKLSTSVKTLVDIVWKEAIGTVSASVDVTSVTTEKVNKAAVTLAQIKRMLVEGGATEKQLEDKSKQFYSQICHKGTNHDAIDTKRKINQMQELCTLLQDVMNVQEASDWKKNVNITNKYRSLRCNIQSVDTYSSQYQTVMRIIGKEAVESSRIQVTNVYSLTRPLEDSIFAPKGRKVTSLVHATRPTSLLGILSRGLLPPKIVQEDVGIERRDYGFLGQGIYFGDDIRSNMHFTEPNGCTKTRFLLTCEVIVGKQYKTCQHQPDLVNPPPGYDSVLGVKNSDGNHSMFKHNEYTIYDVGQQRLSYLIEFVQVNETPAIYQPEFSTEDVEEPTVEEKNKEIDVSDVMDVSDPLDKVTPGLQTSGGQPVLLERVSVKAKMMDLVAQVTVFQRYRNTNTKPIEAKYVFPLDDTAAVCGFEAFIGDKHIVGEVKEKETAHKEYREAVSQGHGAYLMDEESADVFTVSVGNLPPSTEVIIKIIYVVELSLDDDHIVFHLPGSLASWRKEGALAEETQNVTSTVSTGDEKIKFEMSLSMEMPFDIQTIKCSTHDIKIKRTAAKACITLAEGEDCLKEGFHLSVKLHKIHQPHMWVEQNPNDKDSQACMLTFYPEFEVPQLKKPDVTVILDCSNSMKGESFEHAKKVCYMIASLMPKNYRFNLVKFGTNFKEFYPASRLSSKIDFDELKDFLAGASPAEGNTDVWRPLHSHYLLEGENLRNVFIISDGHINNETETLKSIAKNSSHTRIFTFGVSTTCNKHMLKIMARSGAGSFEFFDGKTKSAWQRKVKNQLRRAGQPSVNSLSVKWHQFDNYAPKPRQAPRHLGALFSGSRLVVFGIVPYCTSATLTAVIDGQEISTVVSTSDLCITKGLTLHRLTARALIRDWEDGMLDMDRIEEEIAKEKEKQAIISLSRQYSIVTSLTSFVAIEKREKHEVQRKSNMEEKLKELLQMEDVDVLPYMDWQLRQEMTIDFNDKDKWDKEARKYEDGMHDDEPSSSDEESIENLPSADHEIMDYAEEVIRHFDGEDSTSSESDSSSSVCCYSDKVSELLSHRSCLKVQKTGIYKLGGKLKEVETSDDEEEDTMSFDLGLAEELYDDILYSAAVLRTDSFSSELEELGTNLKEVDTSDDEKEYTMSFDLGPS